MNCADSASRGAPLAVDCVTNYPALLRLEPEWEALLARSDTASPFMTPGWQSAWLDSYGRGQELRVLAVRRAGRLVGLWPLTRGRRGPFRVLAPVGAGRSDWLDILADRQERAAVIQALFAHLVGRTDWDLIECRDVLAESPSVALLEVPGGFSALISQREVRTVAPYLELKGSWESFLGTKRPKFRTNLKYYARLAERDGRTLRIMRDESAARTDAVDELAAVELRSWKAGSGNLKISTPAGRDFYRGFVQYFSDRGLLDLWRAELDGQLIAFLVNLRVGSKCYHYNTCFDEAFGALSPGLLLHSTAIQDAYSRGLSEYDFLSGDEPYKDRWCSAKREILHIAIFRRSAWSRFSFVVLVAARWWFRRSPRFRLFRQRCLALLRSAIRRPQKAQ